MDRIKQRCLAHAIRVNGGNKKHAAKWLGISIRTLRLWEIRYGMRPPRKPYLEKLG